MTRFVSDPAERAAIARRILEGLPEWFGIAESREAYIADCAGQACFCTEEAGEVTGFLALRRTGPRTAEIAVMGVARAWQRRGLGAALVRAAKDWARAQGCVFLQVKTVQMGRYPQYDATNRFYRSQGFEEFECFPTLWDKNNPCQIYVLALRAE